MTGHPSVVIVGAGIVGASLAYHLAYAGAAVTLVERSRPASGATARSFAWSNVVHGNAPSLARLRSLAIADYHRLGRELKGALAVEWNGSLTWLEEPDRTGLLGGAEKRAIAKTELIEEILRASDSD